MRETISNFTGSVPEFYDRYLGPVIFEPYAMDMAGRVGAAGGHAVLELACGTGILTRRLLGLLPADARLMATDLNDPMVEYARRATQADPRLSWRTADALTLPFEDAVFDILVCQFGVMFFPDKRAAAREARRVLRPGGRFLFNVWGEIQDNIFARVAHKTIGGFFPSDPPMFYQTPFGYHDEAAIRADLESAGFRDVRVEVVERTAESASAGDLATGLVRGNPVVLTIQERGTTETGTVVAAVSQALAAEGGNAPFRCPLRALAVSARA